MQNNSNLTSNNFISMSPTLNAQQQQQQQPQQQQQKYHQATTNYVNLLPQQQHSSPQIQYQQYQQPTAQIIQINDTNNNTNNSQNGYQTINSLLNGAKNIAIAAAPPTTPKKVTKTLNIPNITSSPQQQQQQLLQQPVLNLNIVNTSPNNSNTNGGQLNSNIKLLNTNSQPQRIIIQPQQQQQQLQQLFYSPNSANIQLVNASPQQQQQQQQQTFILQNNTNQLNTTNNVVQGGGNIAFLNINNRMVPVQTLNLATKQGGTGNHQTAQVLTPQLLQQLQQQQQQQGGVKLVIQPTNDENNSVNRIIVAASSSAPTLGTVTTTTTASTQQQHQLLPKQQSSNMNTYYVIQPATTANTTNAATLNQQQPNTVNFSSLQQQPAKVNIVLNNTSTTNLAGEIAEKMKTLEQIQLQLKNIQLKLANQVQQDQRETVLTSNEQQTLEHLLQKRKEVQAEIQQLKQKLLSPAAVQQQQRQTSSDTQTVNGTGVNIVNTNNNINKHELYQNISNKIDNLKAKIDTNTHTNEEFEQYRKLTELKIQLQNALQLTSGSTTSSPTSASTILMPIVSKNNNESVTTTTSPNSTTTTVRSVHDLSLNEKIKILNALKVQIQTLKTKEASKETSDKIALLVKKSEDLQMIIQKQQQQPPNGVTVNSYLNNNNNHADQQQQHQQLIISNLDSNSFLSTTPTANKIFTISGTNSGNIKNIILSPITSTNSTPTTVITPGSKKQLSSSIKIRNVPITSSSSLTNTTSSNNSLVNLVQSSSSASNLFSSPTSLQNMNQKLKLLKTVNMSSIQPQQQQQKPPVDFKILNYELLCQSNVVSRSCDEKTLKLLKQLDEKLLMLDNPEKQQAFIKNQVVLVDKYLKQFLAKDLPKNPLLEALNRDQELACKTDYKTPFRNMNDAFERLSHFHVFQKMQYEPSLEECEKFEDCFEKVSEKYIKAADTIKKRFHLLQLRAMQRRVLASEETMLLKLYLEDAKKEFEEEKKLGKQVKIEDIENFKRKLAKYKRLNKDLYETKDSDLENDDEGDDSPVVEEAKHSLIKRFKYELGEDVKQENESIKQEVNNDYEDDSYVNTTGGDNGYDYMNDDDEENEEEDDDDDDDDDEEEKETFDRKHFKIEVENLNSNSDTNLNGTENNERIRLKLKIIKNNSSSIMNNEQPVFATINSATTAATELEQHNTSNDYPNFDDDFLNQYNDLSCSTNTTTNDANYNTLTNNTSQFISNNYLSNENSINNMNTLNSMNPGLAANTNVNANMTQSLNNTHFDDEDFNNFSCLDDFIMTNEDELAVASMLEFELND